MKSCDSCKYQPGCENWHYFCEKESGYGYYCDNYIPEGWVNVNDALPELGLYVLVYSVNTIGVWIGKRVSETKFVLVDDYGYDDGITYWMPLPNSPLEVLK